MSLRFTWTRRRRILAAALVVLIVVPVIGWIYEQYAVRRDTRRFPPPGQFVDAGGRRLHYVCAGSGGPTVLFEVGGFNNSASFGAARSELSRNTRVCIYDRMGIGWSEPGPSAIPVSLLADDLSRVLDGVSPREPVILVATSVGGLIVEFFARHHPDRVAGLIFLDAGNSRVLRGRNRRDILLLARGGCGVVRAAGAVALLRLLDPWRLRREHTEQAARSAALMYGAKPWAMLCGMVRAVDTTVREFDDAPALRPEIPLTVFSAESRQGFLPPVLDRWFQLGDSVTSLRQSHQRFARGSARGTWRMVPGSDHLIASSQPQAVVDAVREMISASARTGER